MGLLAGRIAIITGSSSGLGRATAMAFMKHGATVVCADLSPSTHPDLPTHEAIQEQGGKSKFVQTDVAHEESVQSLVRSTVEAFGRVDM